jgi:hypothetical protein
VAAFEANIGRAGDVIKGAIAAACERHGEGVVIEKITLGAKRGARTWAYIEKMLSDAQGDQRDGTAARLVASWRDWTDGGESDPFAEQARLRAAEREKLTPEECNWQDAYHALVLQNKQVFGLWLADARLVRVDGGVYVIGVGTQYAVDVLTKQHQRMVARTLRGYAGDGADVRFVMVEAVTT